MGADLRRNAYRNKISGRKKENEKRKRKNQNSNQKWQASVDETPSETHDEDPNKTTEGSYDVTELIAAAYVFECNNSTRVWGDPRTEDTKASKTVLGKLLDGVALLFARYKKTREDDTQSTADYVTATAYKEANDGDPAIIYIAKNGGPSELDDIDDKDFARELSQWYNSVSSEPAFPQPSSDAAIWNSMIKFWKRRLETYVDRVKDLRALWNKYHASDLGPLEQELADSKKDLFVGRIGDANLHGPPVFKLSREAPYYKNAMDDRRQVMELLKLCEKFEESSGRHRPLGQAEIDENLKTLINDICFEVEGDWKQEYDWKAARLQANADARTVFRKFVKAFKMLRTLRSIWNAFSQFHKDHPKLKLCFRVLDSPVVTPLSTSKLGRAIEDWWERWWEKHSHEFETDDHGSKPRDNLKKTLRQRSESGVGFAKKLYKARCRVLELEGRFDRLVHCELQLLNIPEVKLDPYFGCSKLSCYFCWELLQSLNFSTRNTHGKMYPYCAFPLGSLDETARETAENCLNFITSNTIAVFEDEEFRRGILHDWKSSARAPLASSGHHVLRSSTEISEESEESNGRRINSRKGQETNYQMRMSETATYDCRPKLGTPPGFYLPPSPHRMLPTDIPYSNANNAETKDPTINVEDGMIRDSDGGFLSKFKQPQPRPVNHDIVGGYEFDEERMDMAGFDPPEHAFGFNGFTMTGISSEPLVPQPQPAVLLHSIAQNTHLSFGTSDLQTNVEFKRLDLGIRDELEEDEEWYFGDV